jgi:type II secretory pathway component PulC
MPDLSNISPEDRRALIDSVRQDPTSILGMADLRPQFDGKGGVSGIRISSVQAGSLIDQMGLKEGDVIKEFNGIPIDNPRQSITLLREIQQATKLNVVVEKPDGTTTTVNYEDNQ